MHQWGKSGPKKELGWAIYVAYNRNTRNSSLQPRGSLFKLLLNDYCRYVHMLKLTVLWDVTLMMEALITSETLVILYETTLCNISEDIFVLAAVVRC